MRLRSTRWTHMVGNSGTWRCNEEGGVRGNQGLQPGGQLAAAAGAQLQPGHARPQQQRSIWRLQCTSSGHWMFAVPHHVCRL
jgi:hypothetical protein